MLFILGGIWLFGLTCMMVNQECSRWQLTVIQWEKSQWLFFIILSCLHHFKLYFPQYTHETLQSKHEIHLPYLVESCGLKSEERSVSNVVIWGGLNCGHKKVFYFAAHKLTSKAIPKIFGAMEVWLNEECSPGDCFEWQHSFGCMNSRALQKILIIIFS